MAGANGCLSAEERADGWRPAAGSSAAAPDGEGIAQRVYQVVAERCVVRETPVTDAKRLTVKSAGARVACVLGVATRDGWLKLYGEPGWLLAESVLPEKGEVGDDDALCAVEVDGETRLMNKQGVIIDPATETSIGFWSPEEQRIVPMDAVLRGCREPSGGPQDSYVDILMSDAAAGPGSVADAEEEPSIATVHRQLEQADRRVEQKLYRAAAQAYGEAVEACRHVRTVDLDFEHAILRKRAACWARLSRHKELLVDAERLLCYDAKDGEALAWQRLARKGLKGLATAAKDAVSAADRPDAPATAASAVTDVDALD